MQQDQFNFLISGLGQEVISNFDFVEDPISAVTKLRKAYPQIDPQLISAAITQAKLRQKASTQNYPVHFVFTEEGLQQATRPQVAKYRAELLLNKFGPLNIVDLTCGLGVDSYYLSKSGHHVTSVELDRNIARIAEHNLSPVGVQVVNYKAEDFEIPADTDLVFLDPARREPGGAKSLSGQTKRVMDPMKWSPNWEFLIGLTNKFKVVAKVAPGIDSGLLENFDTFWISCDGDLVEAMLLSPGAGSKTAVLIDGDICQEIPGGEKTSPSEIGNYLIVPNPALIRASSLNYLAKAFTAGLVNEHIAWLTSKDETAVTKFLGNKAASIFQILDHQKFNENGLASYVQSVAPDALTIMTRGVDLDPELLRKKLLKRPTKGGGELVLAIYRDDTGTQVLCCRRLNVS